MRTYLLTLAPLLVACGSTDPSTWEKCDSAPCHTDGSSRWDVYADGGSVTGSHDFLGPADPYLCLTIDDMTHCSASVSDSNDPRWHDLLFSDIGAADFVGRAVSVGYFDKDTGTWLDDDDTLCSGSLTITEDDLANGGARFDCQSGSATVTFHFVR